MATRIELGQTYSLAVSRDGFRKGAKVRAVYFDEERGVLVRSASSPSRSTYVHLSELASAA